MSPAQRVSRMLRRHWHFWVHCSMLCVRSLRCAAKVKMQCPFSQAWWLGSEDHLAAFLSAEAVLRKHYSRCSQLPSHLLSLHSRPADSTRLQAGQLQVTGGAAASMLCRLWCRFILDAQAFPEPPSVQKQYEDLCRMPALVEGI